MSKEMLINVSEGEECRIALLEDGRLEELYMERTSSTSHVGNIYKGRVTNVEPSIQAAFVDFGLGRNGFLHISDLMPTYFGRRGEEIQESVGRKMSRRDRPPIQRCLRRGDEIIVQIIKEGIGTKGPTLSTYLSIPGKMLVMMPGMGKMGVSKKIEDEQERRRLRQILDGLKPPKDVAFIIRTAGVGKTKVEIERDLKYLTRLWEMIVKKEEDPAPVELYTEGDLVTRTVRDLFSPDVERVVVDNKDVAQRVKEVIKISSPRAKNRVDLYEDPVPLFHKAGIEAEIEMMYSRHVPLPGGGSLVIDSTEAVVAIDVNSGKFRDHNDAEMTAFKTDMEAADEIPRQLKLRDLGGVIICDFIDLRFERHRRELEERLFENFKNDRAKTKVLRMSQFGIIEITRQRMRPSLKRSIYFDCPHCKGAGLIKTPESISLDVMRKVSIALADLKVVRVELSVCPDVAFYLLNKKRATLTELEFHSKKKILIRTDASLGLDELKFELFDARDFAVVLEEIGMMLPSHPHTSQLRQSPAGHTHQGRSTGRNQRGRNDRKSNARPVPARALEDDGDELDEDLAAIDLRNDSSDEHDDRSMNLPDREEDPTDIPAILETEAGDEIAEELADEEIGEGQSAGDESDDDAEDDRPAQREQPRFQQNRKDQQRLVQDRLPQDQGRSPQDRPPENRNFDNRNQQNRQQQDRNLQERHPQDRHPQDRRPEDRQQGRQQQGRAPQDRQQQDRPPQDRYPQDRPPQARSPQSQPLEQGQNRSGGHFNDQLEIEGPGGEQGDGSRRRRRRRGRRGRGRGGQGQNNSQGTPYNDGPFESNGNVGPGAVDPQGEYADEREPFESRDPAMENGDDSFGNADRPLNRTTGNRNKDVRADNAKSIDEASDRNTPSSFAGDKDAGNPERTDGDESAADGTAANGNAPGSIDGEQRPRRRRRRGGRRHRRRNAEGNLTENSPVGEQSQPTEPQDDETDGLRDESDEAAAELINREAEPMEKHPLPVRQTAPDADVSEDRESAVVEISPAEMESDENKEMESAPAPKRKGKRAPRAKAAKAPKALKATAKPKRIPPKKASKTSAAAGSFSAETSPEVPQPPVVRTGSADKHLISDEPVLPPSISRPRSYNDLDAIPDDYD